MTDSIEGLKHRLRTHREMKRAGKVAPKRSENFLDKAGRSEFCAVTGLELQTKEGLMWLHRLGQALILSGVCYDSHVDTRASTPGHTAFGLQRNIVTGNKARPGLWEWFQIPNGALNNMDTTWVVKKILEPKEHDLVFTEFFRK